jgi:hypothetical protein
LFVFNTLGPLSERGNGNSGGGGTADFHTFVAYAARCQSDRVFDPRAESQTAVRTGRRSKQHERPGGDVERDETRQRTARRAGVAASQSTTNRLERTEHFLLAGVARDLSEHAREAGRLDQQTVQRRADGGVVTH